MSADNTMTAGSNTNAVISPVITVSKADNYNNIMESFENISRLMMS
jgi:hypothetical protein